MAECVVMKCSIVFAELQYYCKSIGNFELVNHSSHRGEIIDYRNMYTFAVQILNCFRRFLLAAIVVVPVALGSPAVTNATDIEATANTLFKSFTGTNAVDVHLGVDPENAVAVQDFFIALLRPTWGMDVGYAAQATKANKTAQDPPTGILLENMFTGTRAVIHRSFGIDMQAAAELYFRVKSTDLNTAQTREEALLALHSVIPGVRLSDVMIPDDIPANPSLLSAANLEVRMCVLAGDLELDGNHNWIHRLSTFSVAMFDQDKQKFATKNPSMSVHPLDAVLATRDALLQRGIQIQPGDILAVGALTDSYSIENLTRLRVEYEGLSEEQPVFVYMGFQ